MTTGHWFCDGKCDDVVFLPRHTDKVGAQKCPVCHQRTAHFVPESPPATRESAAGYFQQMRELIAAAPDLTLTKAPLLPK
jgi:hypothetical protein